MLKFLPLLLAVGYAVMMYLFSSWRTKQMLTRQSRPLRDPDLLALTARLAAAQGIDRGTLAEAAARLQESREAEERQRVQEAERLKEQERQQERLREREARDHDRDSGLTH